MPRRRPRSRIAIVRPIRPRARARPAPGARRSVLARASEVERVPQRRLVFVASGATLAAAACRAKRWRQAPAQGGVSRTIASSRASVYSRRGRSSISRAWSRSRSTSPSCRATAASGSRPSFSTARNFGIVGWTVPEGSRSSFKSLLLGYYRDDGQLIYAGRAGTGTTDPS